ncbi:GntR family transcriptional regulator [Desulfobacula sp.]
MKEGEKIPPDRTLSETIGVSRVVIQEAVRSLERAGFFMR